MIKKEEQYRYGEYFPTDFSPFAYNETVAHDYFPLKKEQTATEGYVWKEPEIRNYSIDIETEHIPNEISKTNEDIIGKVIKCEHSEICTHGCTTAFKITPEEFQLYQKLGIAIPHFCPNCRYGERFTRRNPLRFWHRVCQCQGNSHHPHGEKPCQNDFETTYSPEKPEILYCESCYQQETS